MHKLRLSRIVVLLVLALFVVGCGASVQTKVTKVYTATGPTVIAVHDAIQNACTSGVVSADQCTKLKADYIKAATAFKSAGDVLMQINTASEDLDNAKKAIAAGQTGGNVTALQATLNTLNAQYPQLLNDASAVITTLINALASIGVNVKL